MSVIFYSCIIYNRCFFSKNKAEEMKPDRRMMQHKPMMSTKEHAEKMKEMHAMMEQTTNSLDQLIDLNQEMIGAMQKQPAKN
jgi:hypothetical protein